MSVAEGFVYNGVGFVIFETPRKRGKSAGKIADFYNVINSRMFNNNVLITTMEGFKALNRELDLVSDDDLKLINKAMKHYFRSEREFKEFISALALSQGLMVKLATRPTAFYIASVGEYYDLAIRPKISIYASRPVLHLPYLPDYVKSIGDDYVRKITDEFTRMSRGDDGDTILTEFFKDGKRVISRKLTEFNGERVIFDDGSEEVKERLTELVGSKQLADKIIRWVGV